MSDTGSKTGAAVLRQVRSAAAIGTGTLPLTCADAPDQQGLTHAYLVRDEQSVSSNPVTSTRMRNSIAHMAASEAAKSASIASHTHRQILRLRRLSRSQNSSCPYSYGR